MSYLVFQNTINLALKYFHRTTFVSYSYLVSKMHRKRLTSFKNLQGGHITVQLHGKISLYAL